MNKNPNIPCSSNTPENWLTIAPPAKIKKTTSSTGCRRSVDNDSIYIVDKINSEDLKKSIRLIEDILICCVCQDTVKLPALQCVNSHLICSSCKVPEMLTCPSCRQAFTPEKPSHILTQILNVFPRYCKNVNCNIVIIHGDDHESVCEWRMIKCLVRGCDQNISVSDLIHHVDLFHPGVSQKEPIITQVVFNPLLNINREDSAAQHVELIYVSGHMFWKVEVYDDVSKQLYISTHPIPNGKTNDKVEFIIHIKSEKTDLYQTVVLNMNDPTTISEYQIVLPEFVLKNYTSRTCKRFTKIVKPQHNSSFFSLPDLSILNQAS